MNYPQEIVRAIDAIKEFHKKILEEQVALPEGSEVYECLRPAFPGEIIFNNKVYKINYDREENAVSFRE